MDKIDEDFVRGSLTDYLARLKYREWAMRYLVIEKGIISDNSDKPSNGHALFAEIEENREDYEALVRMMGMNLFMGPGYCFAYSIEKSEDAAKLDTMVITNWIQIVHLMNRLVCGPLNPGYQFELATLEARMNLKTNLLAFAKKIRTKSGKLPAAEDTAREIVEAIAEYLETEDTLECVDKKRGRYKVLNAYSYYDELVRSIVQQWGDGEELNLTKDNDNE